MYPISGTWTSGAPRVSQLDTVARYLHENGAAKVEGLVLARTTVEPLARPVAGPVPITRSAAQREPH